MLLEQLITSEFEGPLEEVTSSGGTETGQESAGTLLGDDLAETSNESLVVCDGVQLYSSLDAVNRESLASCPLLPRRIASSPPRACSIVIGNSTLTHRRV